MKARASRRRAPSAPPERKAGPRRTTGRFGVAAALAFAALLACAPMLLRDALPAGSDVYSNTHYLSGFLKALGEGDLYPRWLDATNRGLGAPVFVLVPPLFFYGAAAATAIAGGLVGGIKLWLLVVALLTAGAFYLLAREWAGPGPPAAAAAALYLLLPYRVLDQYQRFAMSETVAFLFLPLVLLYARRAIRGRGRWSVAGLAISYAGLIATHLVSTLSFSLLLGGWLLWEARGRWRALVVPAAGLACGVGLAAPIVVPAMIEKADVNIGWVREMPNGDFRINFIFKDDPLPRLGFRDPIKPLVLRSAHAQLLLAAASGAIALLMLPAAAAGARRDAAAMLAGCAIAYLLQLEISTPIWRVVPELATIQFPWRFQMFMVLTAALLGGLALRATLEARARSLPILVLLLAAAPNLWLAWRDAHVVPFAFSARAAEAPAVREWVEPSLTPVAFEPYRDFRYRPMELPGSGFVGAAGSVTETAAASSRRVVAIESDAGGEVRLRHFWFPGWRATIDGAPLEIGPSSPYGYVRFVAPAGRHTVELRFGSTPARRAAVWGALAALAAIGTSAAWATRLRSLAGAEGSPVRP